MQPPRIVTALAFLIVTLVSGCAPDNADADQSFWNIMTVAQAEQSEAPALALVDGSIVVAWVGTDTRGVHHDARMIGTDGLTEVVTLPLPPRQPRAQQLLPGSSGAAQLLWLDADEGGTLRLYSALISTPGLTVIRGPTTVSDQPALRYAALPEPGGGMLVAWAGGQPAEPSVTIQRIDNEGRPTEVIGHIQAANFPALLRVGSVVQLYWLSEENRAAYRTIIEGNRLQSPLRLTSSPSQAAGDLLLDLRAGTDRGFIYLFWNLARADGACETWFASGAADNPSMSPPTALKITVDTDASIETGFNSGPASRASLGDTPVCMAAPLLDSGDTLPVGVQIDLDTAILYLRDGQIMGQQVINAGAGILRPSTLLSDGDRNLYLSWSEPTAAGIADLKLARSGAR